MKRNIQLGAALLLLAGSVVEVTAQDAGTEVDSIRVLDPIVLDPIVVTAQRAASALSLSTGSVSVLAPRQLRQLPQRSLADALAFVPGLVLLDVDGTGQSPQLIARGFYGGGEAEYVLVLLNGRPVNSVENGLINWDQILAMPSTSVEVLRGGASSLYGDAAIGAVLNVRAELFGAPSQSIGMRGGSRGVRGLTARVSDERFSLFGAYSASDGWRDHSGRSSASLSGAYRVVDSPDRSVSVTAGFNNRDYDVPGPLRSTDPEGGDRSSLGFFRFDRGSERTARATLDGRWRAGSGDILATATSEFRDFDLTRTLPLSSDFADTQDRLIEAVAHRGSLQWADISLPLGMANGLLLGLDASRGGLSSRYYAIATGGLDDAYASASGIRGEALSDGSATRTGLAGYAHLDLQPTSRLKVSVGGRWDWIDDQFEDVEGLSEPAAGARHTAFSPKAGFNLRYASTESQVGNLYVSASRSFKAPTMDQLYDLRAFPVPFPPYSIQIASASLVPQEGTSYEAGVYHVMSLRGDWAGRVDASVYTMDMTNEIDFSFETFSNINIGKSRHRGIETGLRFDNPGEGAAFFNYTLQDVTSRIGDNKGKAIKAIPRHAFAGGLTVETSSNVGVLAATFTAKSVRGAWVDDANEFALADFTTADVRLSLVRNSLDVGVDIFNALDRRYSSTAYPDPAGSEVLFLFPGVGRAAELGLTYTF